MALFRVQVNYTRGIGEKWSNVWHCTATGMADCIDDWTAVGVLDLQPVLDSSCQLKSLLISEVGSDAFSTVDVNVAGSRSGSGDLLPLFNSAKVIFPDSAFGRPDLKYLKGLVTEADQTAGVLVPGTVTEIDTRITTLLSDMSTAGTILVTQAGTAYGSVTVQPAVQMRQMHRKRRRSAPTP